MNALGLNQFVRDVLPGLIAGKPRLHALFATYNAVRGYRVGGQVDVGKPGLSVTVQNGNLRYSAEVGAALYGGMAIAAEGDLVGAFIADIGAKMQREEAADAQSALERSVSETPIDAAVPLFAVVYVGYSAFDQAVDFATQLRADRSDATLVVVTCDCDLSGKRGRLQPLVRDGIVQHVIVTSGCGGSVDMGRMVNALIEAWPAA